MKFIRTFASKSTKPFVKPTTTPQDTRLTLIKQMLYSKDSSDPRFEKTHIKNPKISDPIIDKDLDLDQIERSWMAFKILERNAWQEDIQKLYKSSQHAMDLLQSIDSRLFKECLTRGDGNVPMKSRIPVEVVGMGWDYDLDRGT
jgi:Mitochondrial ribosomal protein L28